MQLHSKHSWRVSMLTTLDRIRPAKGGNRFSLRQGSRIEILTVAVSPSQLPVENRSDRPATGWEGFNDSMGLEWFFKSR